MPCCVCGTIYARLHKATRGLHCLQLRRVQVKTLNEAIVSSGAHEASIRRAPNLADPLLIQHLTLVVHKMPAVQIGKQASGVHAVHVQCAIGAQHEQELIFVARTWQDTAVFNG